MGNRGSADHPAWWSLLPHWRRTHDDPADDGLDLAPTSSAPVDEVRRRLAGEWEPGSDQTRRREPRNRSSVPAGRLGTLATNQRPYPT